VYSGDLLEIHQGGTKQKSFIFFFIRLLLSVHVHAVKFAEVKDQMLIFSDRYLDRCNKQTKVKYKGTERTKNIYSRRLREDKKSVPSVILVELKSAKHVRAPELSELAISTIETKLWYYYCFY